MIPKGVEIRRLRKTALIELSTERVMSLHEVVLSMGTEQEDLGVLAWEFRLEPSSFHHRLCDPPRNAPSL